MGFTVDRLVLSDEQQMELERRSRAHTSSHREVRRARAILLCAEGWPLRQIGIEIGMDQHKVGEWRKRFLAEGVDGLDDKPRSGRPRRIGHDDRMRLAAVATSDKGDEDPTPGWTHQEIADALGLEGVPISASQVGRILGAMNLDVTRVRGWLNRRDDPGFWDRVRDVCGLYLNCPDNAVVVSVDEKTSVQAKERKYKDQPAKAGQQRRREWEYIRHGTASLFAALDVHSGEVLAEPIPGKNDSVNFCDFLDQIERSIDPSLRIHVVLDNGSSHTSKHTKAWLAAHPRWTTHFTPPHASWVNQVEMFFSILQRKVIKNGSFKWRDDLIAKLLKFIADYDQLAKPFKWTYAADPLVA
ncbi:MAG: IS630 family transposase [Acidimicrobiales bacterium]